jgi:indole-3-glycerol phosphate synthase
MNILEEIIQSKYKEVQERKISSPISELEKSTYFTRPTFSLKESVLREDKSGIIAEIKRRSPSKGDINTTVSVAQTSVGYAAAGASALSILTDKKYFGGSSEDLTLARSLNTCPILRKDFVVDEYQIIEAKSIGADAILLIAAALTPKEVKTLTTFAHSLRLEVLLEVHNEAELIDNENVSVDLLGVNNRDLKSFKTDIGISKRLASLISNDRVKVSESGIESPDTILELENYGYIGFLMGQNFMQEKSPELACKNFVSDLNALRSKEKLKINK